MFFSKTKYKDEPNLFVESLPRSFLVWLEIGVVDMVRAVAFYENVFKVKIEIRYLFDNKSVGSCLYPSVKYFSDSIFIP